MVIANNLMVVKTVCALGILLSVTSSLLFDNRASNPFKYDGAGRNGGRRSDSFTWSPEIAFSGGDLILSALLPAHVSQNNRGLCNDIYGNGIVLVEAIVFALREVHRRKLLPENITMGYEIRDTCNSVLVSQRHTLDIVLETIKQQQNRKYPGNDKLTKHYNFIPSPGDNVSEQNMIAVLGAGNSQISIAVNRLLSASGIPQIGFASTSKFLSDKTEFPSFFRVVPPDSFQVKALVSLLRNFSWNYVGLLVSDGDYGRPLAESFKTMAKDSGVCIGFERLVPHSIKQTRADVIAKELSLKTELDIIVILLSELDVETILTAMLKIGLSNKTLIASDSWSKSTPNYDSKFSAILKGTLGFANHDVQVKEFEDYFLSLKPNTNTWNPWFNETWEHLFHCKLQKPLAYGKQKNVSVGKSREIHRKFCSLSQQQLSRKHFTGFHHVYNVINAVFSIAHGVRQFCQSLRLKSNVSSNRFTPCLPSLNPQALLGKLKNMRFPGYYGEEIRFDQNGDVEGKYDLVNILSNLVAENVGVWQESEKTETLRTNVSNIEWNSAQGPEGTCAQPCPPGMYQRPLKSDPRCCSECQRCYVGTISNGSSATSCTSCREHFVSNSDRTACIFIPVTCLDWRSSWTISIVVVALLSIFILIVVGVMFFRYANTPVVKSANRELSFLICSGLLVTFMVPFAYAGRPTKAKCTISQVMFCVGTALALSAMLAKTIRLVLVFEMESRNPRRKWLVKNKYEIAMTLVLTFVELTYCLLWVAINPPGVKSIWITSTKRYLICEFDTFWYGGSHMLLIILSLACTGLAVKGRNLPKNYNEMKHITFSMFTFNIVWVVFMGAQYGASLEYDAKINCFAVIISSMMILVLLFGPKIFMIIFRPHLNRREEFQEDARRYAFRHSASRSASPSISVNSLKRGSLSNLHLNNHGVDAGDHLNVPNDFIVFQRKRGNTFPEYSPFVSSNNLYHSSESMSGSKKTSTKGPGRPTITVQAFGDQGTPALGKLTIPTDDQQQPCCHSVNHSNGTLICSTHKIETDHLKEIRRRRCKFCYQTINGFSVSLPNIPTAYNINSDKVTHSEKESSPPVVNNSLKSIPSSSGQEKNKTIQSTKESETHDQGIPSENEFLRDKDSSYDSNGENPGTSLAGTPQIHIVSFDPLPRSPHEKSFTWDKDDVDMLKVEYEFARETIL